MRRNGSLILAFAKSNLDHQIVTGQSSRDIAAPLDYGNRFIPRRI
jgi:hypothetical protein